MHNNNQTPKLTYTVSELANALSIGKNAAYSLCHSEGFPALIIGKRIIIPVDGLHEWMRSQSQGRPVE